MVAACWQWWLTNHWIRDPVEHGWRIRCVLPNIYMRCKHSRLHKRWAKSLLGYAIQIPGYRCELLRQFTSIVNCEDSRRCCARCACSSNPGIGIEDWDHCKMESTDLTRRSACRVIQCVFDSCRWRPNTFRIDHWPFESELLASNRSI